MTNLFWDSMVDVCLSSPKEFEEEAAKAEKKIKEAKIDLLLKQPFFASLLFEMETTPTRSPTLSVNHLAELHYNPFLVNKASPDDLMFFLAHEIMHVVFMHLYRVGKRDPDLWNIAGDFVINLHLTECGFKLDDNHLKLIPHSTKFKGMTTEEVYDYLLKEMEKRKKKSNNLFELVKSKMKDALGNGSSGGGSNSDQQQSSQDQQGSGQEGQQGGQKDQKGHDGQQDQQPGNSGSGSGQQKKSEIEKILDEMKAAQNEDEFWEKAKKLREELKKNPPGTPKDGIDNFIPCYDQCDHAHGKESEIERKIREMVSRASTLARQQGKMPANIEREINKLLYPKVPWERVLEQFVEDVFLGDYDWNVPDRTFLSHDIVIPSPHDTNVGEIVIAIDTSGSVRAEELERAASELNAIFQRTKPKKIWVVYCDYDISHVDEFMPEDEIVFKPKGGGGTSFIPVFKWVQKEGINPKCLIYFTDTWGDFPRNEPEYPVLWGVFDSKNAKKVPFGQVIVLD